jgi:mRNA deadenylase 3'-5' endonuclease subunit Ccr4
VGLTTPPQFKKYCYEIYGSQNQTDLPKTTTQRIKRLRIGTWNVLSLYKSGALKKLLSQLDSYKTDIIALQEIRWTGEGIIDKKNRCDRKRHMFRKGFS